MTDEDLAHRVRRVSDANRALLRGDIGGYPSLVDHAKDHTLMAPFGGAPARLAERARLAEMARFSRSGEGEVEPVRCRASGDLAVLAGIERQRAEVGGLPERDWSLRVALAFRREGPGGWRLSHRHADPLANELASRRPKV